MFCFIASFAFVLQRHIGQAHTPLEMYDRVQRLPPGGSWRRRRLRENALHEGFHKSKVAQAPSTANAVPLPLGGRLLVSTMIPQIGRKNKCFLCRNLCVTDRRGRRSLQIVIFLMRRSLKACFFLYKFSSDRCASTLEANRICGAMRWTCSPEARVI